MTTLNKAIDLIEREGGHFHSLKNGVKYESDDITGENIPLPTAEELVGR